jgi:hypothetical protein
MVKSLIRGMTFMERVTPSAFTPESGHLIGASRD